MSKKQETKQELTAVIAPPNLQLAQFKIRGTAPYVQNKFSKKAKEIMHSAQAEGSKSKNKNKKDGKNFDSCFAESQHIASDGWCGIPAPAFRNAMISACRVAGFTMTKAKLSVFVLPDGFDEDDGTPLVKITKGEPKYHESHVRLATGVCDLRARAMWQAGWEATVTVRFDADQFDHTDVANLLLRVGQQVGIGEGRPDSRQSAGMGWGLFDIV